MSHEEQIAQHDSIKNIEAFADTIKKWWPLMVVVCILIGTGASVATAFFHYDNDNKETYASKTDVKAIVQSNTELKQMVITLSDQIKIKNYRDSLGLTAIKTTIDQNKQEEDDRLTAIKRQFSNFSFVTGKWNKKRTVETFAPAE